MSRDRCGGVLFLEKYDWFSREEDFLRLRITQSFRTICSFSIPLAVAMARRIAFSVPVLSGL